MRENLAEKYMAMSADEINSALFGLHDESSRLNNTIDKMTFENDGADLESNAEKASKLGRKLRFINHCILTANKCLGIKNKAQKREDHFNSLNCKYENLKAAAKSVLGREEFEAVWFEFIKIEEAKK
jgi:hypothetical protein